MFGFNFRADDSKCVKLFLVYLIFLKVELIIPLELELILLEDKNYSFSI
jgi:hypothetical protein